MEWNDFSSSDSSEDDTLIMEAGKIMDNYLIERSQRQHGLTRQPALDRDREGANETLIRHYFSPEPVYDEEHLRRRFLMIRQLFMRLANDFPERYLFYQQREDARGRLGFTSIQKCTAALRQLAYGISSDAMDEYIAMSEDLSNKVFQNAIKALSPLKLRLGGSLQDELVYETEDQTELCIPFSKNTSALFGFNPGCLPLSRWDELNNFFNETGAMIIFGLNALNGRQLKADGSTVGAWDSTNAESLMRYTVKKNYTMYAWELGNELCGSGVGARVTADQYAIDTTTLKNIVEDIYDGIQPKPLIISPGGFFDANWFKEFINKTDVLDVVTHHIYNLGAGVDKDLVEKILNPLILDRLADPFKQLEKLLETSGTSVSAWVGEAGGAYNSGHHLVTDAFVFSFWYLDQLGMSAVYDTKTYCRQTLIGGNYGLLNTTTFEPNPDYYSALLWHRLMGKTVLSTNFTGSKKMRSYAHCAKESDGITLLLINLDKTTTIDVTLSDNTPLKSQAQIESVIQDTKRGRSRTREQYHLTAKDGNLHSQTMLLNGNELTLDSAGNIPPLEPLPVSSLKPISVAPYSIVFAHVPYLTLNACGSLVMDF